MGVDQGEGGHWKPRIERDEKGHNGAQLHRGVAERQHEPTAGDVDVFMPWRLLFVVCFFGDL